MKIDIETLRQLIGKHAPEDIHASAMSPEAIVALICEADPDCTPLYTGGQLIGVNKLFKSRYTREQLGELRGSLQVVADKFAKGEK
jgi:hypothetical protein